MAKPKTANPADSSGDKPRGTATRRPVRTARPDRGIPPAMIAAGVAVALAVAAILGFAGWQAWRGGHQPPQRDIPGLVNYRTSMPKALTRDHKLGPLTYPMSPPVGGDHNPMWQNCTGDVYDAPIAAEHAVHSLEHGAVWVTYRPGLPADQVNRLAARVHGKQYLFMSPYPGLDRPISVQAWGYQLKVDAAADRRIDAFIAAFRVSAAPEPGAPCSGGITATGTTPHDVPGGMPK